MLPKKIQDLHLIQEGLKYYASKLAYYTDTDDSVAVVHENISNCIKVLHSRNARLLAAHAAVKPRDLLMTEIPQQHDEVATNLEDSPSNAQQP
jgi:hypothetical protein